MDVRATMTRRGLFAAMLGGLAATLASRPAAAGFSTERGPSAAGPGETVSVRTARGNDHSQMTIANGGPGDAEVVIASWNYNASLTVPAGESVTLTEIFGDRWSRVTNKSATATIAVTTKLPRGASKGAR